MAGNTETTGNTGSFLSAFFKKDKDATDILTGMSVNEFVQGLFKHTPKPLLEKFFKGQFKKNSWRMSIAFFAYSIRKWTNLGDWGDKILTDAAIEFMDQIKEINEDSEETVASSDEVISVETKMQEMKKIIKIFARIPTTDMEVFYKEFNEMLDAVDEDQKSPLISMLVTLNAMEIKKFMALPIDSKKIFLTEFLKTEKPEPVASAKAEKKTFFEEIIEGSKNFDSFFGNPEIKDDANNANLKSKNFLEGALNKLKEKKI